MRCISIHLTDLCNSECSFCVVASPLYAEDTVKFSDIKQFLKDNAGNYDVVNLHGGEPTIHPRFFEILDLINQLGFKETHLQTNGVRLNSSGFLDRLIEANVSKLIVSLHGADAATQEAQTHHRNSFRKIINGLRAAHSRRMHIRTNTVITYLNINQLPQIAGLACDLGVDHVNFSNMHPVGSARFSRALMMPRISEIVGPLCEAIDVVRSNTRAVTLEGFPHCTVTGDGRDLLHLHNDYRAIKMLIRGDVLQDYDDFMRFDMRIQGRACQECRAKNTCGGVYKEYTEFFGWEEIRPLANHSTDADAAESSNLHSREYLVDGSS